MYTILAYNKKIDCTLRYSSAAYTSIEAVNNVIESMVATFKNASEWVIAVE